MEGIGKTDPTIIIREKGRFCSSRIPLLREAVYNNIRTHNVLTLQETNNIERDINCRRMVSITKFPGDYCGCRQKPEPPSGIYMNWEMESQNLIVADNQKKQEEEK